MAVNHGGDSDSTGAVTGNILGAMLGAGTIPGRWLEHLELRDEIEVLADDLFHRVGDAQRHGETPDPDRYPGW